MDPVRDTVLVENTPIDYLDFASPVSGLGGKMGLDATNKWPGETSREWGRVIERDAATVAKVDAMWQELGGCDGGRIFCVGFKAWAGRLKRFQTAFLDGA